MTDDLGGHCGLAEVVALARGWFGRAKTLTDAEWDAAFATALPPPAGPMQTSYLGHCLVGRDMPAMLAEVAGHVHHGQLGWGTSLGEHWMAQVNGFSEENADPAHCSVHEAMESGDYSVLVLTEMVELRDAIRHYDSAAWLADWAALACKAAPMRGSSRSLQ